MEHQSEQERRAGFRVALFQFWIINKNKRNKMGFILKQKQGELEWLY
jgi:hypothetical protein